MIPKEKIEEVRERARIVDVVSEYVPLKKRGHNYLGLCPFHSEKTPSFTVSEEKRIFHCFGCHETGNVITFLMKKEGLEFPDAVRSLAKRYGITIEEAGRDRTSTLKDRLYEVNSAAREYFEKELRTPAGLPARKYLVERGYAGEVALVRGFSIGYAPDRWDGLTDYLRKKGIGLDTAELAGVISRKGNKYYDRFRGRLIFPIGDPKGRTVAFGGRALGKDSGPKYLNSPETAVFRKGEVLYGFHQARKSIIEKKAAIVVEGYFDLLALHRHGFGWSVATMGTALTQAHLRLLKGHAEVVYALFDSDAAGRNAAVRSLELFLDEELPCRVVTLPQGKDPDEFLSKAGPGAMAGAIGSAVPLMEFFLKDLVSRFDTNTPEGKARYFDTAVSFLSRVRNPAERDHYASLAATILGIRPSTVYEALKGGGKARERVAGQSAGHDQGLVKGPVLVELTVLRIVLKHPELFDDSVAGAIERFTDPALLEAGRVISSCYREGRAVDAPALLDELDGCGAKGLVAGLLLNDKEGFIESPGKMLEDCLKKVLHRGRLKDKTIETIKSLEEAGNAEAARETKRRAEVRRGGA